MASTSAVALLVFVYYVFKPNDANKPPMQKAVARPNIVFIMTDDMPKWVCPVSTDCLPLSRGASSHSSLLVI